MTLAHPTDEELLADFRQSGDRDCFAALFERTRPDVVRIAGGIGLGAAEAEDVVQETFLTVLVKADSFDPGRSFRLWVRGIARNVARRRRGRRRAEQALVGEPTARPLSFPDRRLGLAEVRDEVNQAIERLPEGYAAVVRLRYQGQLDSNEIGARLGLPASTVRTRLERGLERLRRLLPAGLTPAVLCVFDLEDLMRTVHPAESSAPAHMDAGPPSVLRGPLGARAVRFVAALALLLGAVALHRATRDTPPARGSSSSSDATPALATPRAADGRVAVATPASSAPTASTPGTHEAPATATDLVELEVRLVRARDGTPLPGVAFGLQRASTGAPVSIPETLARYRPGLSDAHGVARFAALERGTYHVRFAEMQVTEGHEVQRSRSITVPVERVHRVHGRVWEHDDLPAIGAQVWATESTGDSSCAPVQIATTGADGTFEARFAGGEGKWLWAVLPGEARSGTRRVTFEGARSVQLTLDRNTGSVVGRLHASSGVPVADRHVALYRAARQGPPALVRSDAEGRFTCDTLLPGTYGVFALAGDEGVGFAEVQLEPSSTATCEVELRADTWLTGNALDRDGRPASGGYVVVCASRRDRVGYEAALLWRATRIAADGSYRIGPLLTGPAWTLLYDADGLRLSRESSELLPGENLWNPSEWRPFPAGRNRLWALGDWCSAGQVPPVRGESALIDEAERAAGGTR